MSAVTTLADELPTSADDQLSAKIDAAVARSCDAPEIPLATDAEFLRRVFLDLVGRGPNTEEVRSFVHEVESGEESSAALRADLIDDLLSREEFSRYYAKVLEVMFTERREVISPRELRNFIRQWLEDRRPLNELCLEILAADGTGEAMRPAASFLVNRNAEPHLVTRDIGRIFFGRDVQCAQCHDHPLVADYEQAEYFGILSFVHRTYVFQDEKRGNLPFLGEKGEGVLEFASVFKPDSAKSPALPVLPMVIAMDTEPQFADDKDSYVVAPDKEHRGIPRYSRRQQLAVLATHRENLSFNRNIANRLWAQMMGTGVVHPVDMHHMDNPPASAELLRLLSESLVAGKYDLREFLRQIARSKTYQRSSVTPSLEQWAGPAGGHESIESRLNADQKELENLAPQMDQLKSEMQAAADSLELARRDVDHVQKQVDEAKTEFQKLTEAHTKESTKLAEIQARKTKQTELIASLTRAVNEADMVLKITPEDQEVVKSKALFEMRLKTASEGLPTIDEELSDQQETADSAKNRVDDQRSRIHALTNRCLALGEFVAEARGVQRRTRVEMQRVIDRKTELEQLQHRNRLLLDWLSTRERVGLAREDQASATNSELTRQLGEQQTQLVREWQSCFVIRRLRSLSPEQLASATYTALELDRSVRVRANAEWEKAHEANPGERDDRKKREAFVNTALSVDGPWEVLEDLIVERYAAPAGAPQDGFSATVDQALIVQNSAEYLNLLKPGSGNLTERLIAMESTAEIADELYRSVLCRRPTAEETQMIDSLLKQHPEEKASIVQELVWGLLSSSEFRFMY